MESSESNLKRIRGISRFLKVCTWLAACSVPLLPPMIWIFFNRIPPVLKRKMFDHAPDVLGKTAQMLGVGISIPSAILLFLMLSSIGRLLALYSVGKIFESENAVQMRRAALFILLHTIYGLLIAQPLTSVALTLSNPPGQKALAFSLGSGDLTALFSAGFLYLTAWVSMEGHRLKAEGDLTI